MPNRAKVIFVADGHDGCLDPSSGNAGGAGNWTCNRTINAPSLARRLTMEAVLSFV